MYFLNNNKTDNMDMSILFLWHLWFKLNNNCWLYFITNPVFIERLLVWTRATDDASIKAAVIATTN